MKTEIPTADYMKKLATKNKYEFELSVMEGPVFKDVMQKIENAALKGKSQISVNVSENRKELEVIRKYLEEAGYACRFKGPPTFPNLSLNFEIDWSQ